MISILIADDDMNKISSIISCIQLDYQNSVEIKQASTVQEAIEVLQNNEFHLLITDLNMPLRGDELAVKNGGEILIKEIYKGKNKCNTPIYIVGLTQYEEVKHNFSAVWKVWMYDSSREEWKIKLRDLVFHISKVNSKIVKEKKETIFVEGILDKQILQLTFEIYYFNYLKDISIEAISFSGGASWVERQLIIWSKTLHWKDNSKTKYLKAVGLFDNDFAGLRSIGLVKNQIDKDSAENKTFSILKLDRKYAKHLIPLYKKGVQLPITLEEMFPPESWEYAKSKGWLTNRTLKEDFIIQNEKAAKVDLCSRKFFEQIDLSYIDDLYLNYKLNDLNKKDFINYILTSEEIKRKKFLEPFSLLINDILTKLKLLNLDN